MCRLDFPLRLWQNLWEAGAKQVRIGVLPESIKMQIFVNGRLAGPAEACTVAALLEQLGLTGKPVAVEVNLHLCRGSGTRNTSWRAMIGWRSSPWSAADRMSVSGNDPPPTLNTATAV